jgi:cobalt-zinc-cadmium resistance protein CzcA
MIDRILEFSLKNRPMVVLFAVAVLGGGAYALKGLPIDAFPDVSPVLVQVSTEAAGLAPEEVEKLITYPVEVAMNGLPGVTQIKSISAFGLSQVSVYFRDDVDIYFARQLVLEKLQEAKEEIPPGLGEPSLGPITTGLGQIYQYTVGGPESDPTETRTTEDWIVKRNLRTVPGVTDVLSFGGEVKQYQVKINPGALLQYGVTLNEVREALGANNRNVGGGYITRGPEEYLVRGLGLAQGVEDLGNVVVASRDGTPVYVRNVAEVAVGPEVRRGAVTMNGKGEVTTGIVLKRIYENTSQVIESVKNRVAEINRSLPDGMKVKAFYDQSELVQRAVDTVKDALLEGAVLIVLVLFLFLGDVRSALIVTAMLPLSLLLAFLLMRWSGLSANLMSLGGLAIGIGMMVDGGVVMVENVYRHLSEAKHREDHPPGSGALVRAYDGGTELLEAPPETTAEGGWRESRLHHVLRAAREVGRPIVFAISIIILVFLPIFTFQGVEGKMFRPMAFAISFAMVGSLVFSLTVIPVLCSFFLKGGSEEDNWVMRKIKRPYLSALRWALNHRGRTFAVALVALLGSLALVPFLGTEFVPELEEGSILYRATMAPSAGLDEGIRTATEMEKLVKARFPEVQDVISKIGRAEIGGDPEPVNNIEAIVTLKPEEEWTTGRDKAGLVDAMSETLGVFPGVAVGFSQPIATRVDELLSGVKAQLAISLFGEDLDQLVATADQIQRVVSSVPGAADVQTEQVTGQPQLQIEIDRGAIARYGINVEDVQEAIEVAIGGEAAGQVFEGIRRFDINVRLQEPYRADPQAIGNLLIPAPSGAHVPLSQLAAIRTVVGPKQISHDNGQRRIVIQLNVRGRDLGGFVQEAQQKIGAQVQLPPGYFVTWGGEFENQQRAMKRLSIIVPITIGLIFLLLFSSFNSLKQATLIILNVPFAMIGGIVALWVSRQYLSVPASVGFIALFGVAVLNGVVLVSYINDLRRQGRSVEEAVYEGTVMRLRPVLMTATVAILGLLPLLFSSGAGSEVQRPLAAVVVGGLLTSTALTLLLLPTLYGWFEKERVQY